MTGIRAAEHSDLRLLLQLFEESGLETYLAAGVSEAAAVRFLARRDWLKHWQERLAEPLSTAYLAFADGEAAGTGFLRVQGQVALLGGLYARHKRQGIGSALLEARLDRAVQLGAEEAELITAANNQAMLALAEAFGFTAEQEIFSSHFPAIPWLRLRRPL